eukprot:TRINITY_DN397_c1_g1_i1.p1 TRINITY_DN397_c1_g1~~TRINITY_DN397_c1_g1_i1.p1  ORF type:complete len:782 (-),score=197.04 TRINITY_DN397_c1_g1_i1:116-2305(-)
MSTCCCCATLHDDDQLVLKTFTTMSVMNGPGCFCLPCCSSSTARKATTLTDNEYVKVKSELNGTVTVETGPKLVFLQPYDVALTSPQSATTLLNNQYLIVSDQMKGNKFVVPGPCLFYPGPYEATTGPFIAVNLKDTEYIRVTDEETGQIKIEKGSQLYFPGPFETLSETKQAFSLDNTMYIKVEDEQSGKIFIVTGPQLFIPGPYNKLSKVQKAIGLDDTQYVKVLNTETGNVKIVKGPRLFFPGPYDETGNVLVAISLAHNEYVFLQDTEVGTISVVRGKAKVFLSAFQEVIKDKKGKTVRLAINVDEHVSVLVRNTESGQQYLIRRKELYFPTFNEEIMEVRKKIVLENHESMVIKDKAGRFHYLTGVEGSAVWNFNLELQAQTVLKQDLAEAQRKKLKSVSEAKKAIKGKEKDLNDDHRQILDADLDILETLYAEDAGRSFFLPPYCEIIPFHWDTDGDKSTQNVMIERINMRPQFLEYSFVCRTSDNVELNINVTFFWQVLDIKAMLQMTNDAAGDVCAHARSVVIQEVSQITMEVFMKDFNRILSTAILDGDDEFYEERGCLIHRVEVKSYHCADPGTEAVLQEIIKERTDRLNRLQKEQSSNEVALVAMKGSIEEEKLNGELLKIRHSHHRTEAAMQGEAEADQLNMFLQGLPDVPAERKYAMWHTLRQLDQINFLSKSDAHMYFTPDQVKLGINSFETPYGQRPPKKEEAQEKYSFSKFAS